MQTPRILWISATPPGRVSEADCVPTGWTVHRRQPEEIGAALAISAYDAIVLQMPLSRWSLERVLRPAETGAAGIPILLRGASAGEAEEWAHFGAATLTAGGEAWTELAAMLQPLPVAAPFQDPREPWEDLLVGDSRELRQVVSIVRLVAARRCTVLITGETGTGKEMVARCLHLASGRQGPLVAVNCGALPETLLEDELFGHVKGAFTGAVGNRVGRFEQARGGTIFLDEIGELPAQLQVKLLRVLQEREFQRLGSSETIHADVRVVAATNCDLLEAIESGRFREDLYYRLNVVPVQMPSLRERPADVALLARHFVAKVCRAEQLSLKQLDDDAVDRLSAYPWPGNVRQLENAIEMAVALSGQREFLSASDFPLPAARPQKTTRPAAPVVAVPDHGLDYEQTIAIIERSILRQALERTHGNKKAAADMLRLKRTTLAAKMRVLEGQAVC